jgi:nitrogenase molybdenum-iron protein beta chain
MTEDAAVFGGLNNLKQGLQNSYELYKPKMIALCTTCMAEVIGDDIGSYITTTKKTELIPADLPVPAAHTPSFVGSHITGYDNMLVSILKTLTKGKKAETTNGKFNFNLGFDPYVGNIRELKRILGLFGIDYTILSDNSDTFDSPNTGEFKMYNGLTTLEEPVTRSMPRAASSSRSTPPPKPRTTSPRSGVKRPTTSVPLASRAPMSS